MPATLYPVPQTSGSSILPTAMRATPHRLHCFVAKSTGGPVELEIRDGKTGNLILPLNLNDGESAGEDWAVGIWVTDPKVTFIAGGPNLDMSIGVI